MDQKVFFACAVMLTGLSGGALNAATEKTSALWGQAGETWTTKSRLPDFSLAGYAAGRKPIPEVPVRLSVKDCGAKGDGVTDDTAAFQQALRQVETPGAVLVPEGRYVISDVLEMTRSGVVLRGEGQDRSVLLPPKPLSEIHPRGNVDQVKSAYSFSGGFLTMKGDDTGKRIAVVAAPAKRGDNQLTVVPGATIKAGDRIRLVMQDSEDHSLLRHLHGDLVEPGVDTIQSKAPWVKPPIDWAAQVVAVEGDRLTLDRSLRVDVRLEWKPEIFALVPTLHDSGVENLGFEFPGVPKRPHLQEAGYNAVQVTGAVDCWVRNLTVVDADNGVIVGGSRFCTVDGFTSRAVKRTGLTGHHALWATGRTQDVLFIRFRCETTYVHDLTVEGFSSGNVFTQGSGVSINCDHHRNAPYENLFTDFDAGDPRRLFESSGREDRGPHSGARTTFWGLRGKGRFAKLPPAKDWPLLNVIGFGGYPTDANAQGAWVESCEGAFVPVNLWQVQVQRRQAANG